MEAVSCGAASVRSASIEGIISPAVFPFQGGQGNRYLTHRTYTNDLPHRIVTFLRRCQAFVVLPGGLGTLTELALTWNVACVADLQPDTARTAPPLCLLVDRQPWEAVITQCRQLLPISDQFLSHVTYVDSVDDIVSKLQHARTEHQHHQQQKQQQQRANSNNDGSQRTADAAAQRQTRELSADEKSYG